MCPRFCHYLHAAICLVCINKRNPRCRHESIQSRRVKVGVVLVPGNSSLFVVRGLASQIPNRVS